MRITDTDGHVKVLDARAALVDALWSDPLWLPEKPVIEASPELFKRFLKSAETLLPHLCRDADALLGSDDGGPIVLNHPRRVALFKPHDRESDAMLQRLGSVRRCENGVEDSLMEKIHNLLLFSH
jgi:hypothetical protein